MTWLHGILLLGLLMQAVAWHMHVHRPLQSSTSTSANVRSVASRIAETRLSAAGNKANAASSKSDKIRVRLLMDVKGTGKKGDIVFVSSSLWNNALAVKRAAEKISDEQLKAIDAAQLAKIDAEKALAREWQAAFESVGTLKIVRKVGVNGQLFGSVNPKMLVEEWKKVLPSRFEKLWEQRNIGVVDIFEGASDSQKLPEVRKAGSYSVTLRLHPDLPLITQRFEICDK